MDNIEKPSVLMDTNSLLIPFEFKFDVYSELKFQGFSELITLDICLAEVKKIKPRLASAVVNLALQKGVRVIETLLKARNVDDEIIGYAKQHKCLVFTQDVLLRKKLLNQGLRVLIMRQKKYLKVIG